MSPLCYERREFVVKVIVNYCFYVYFVRLKMSF